MNDLKGKKLLILGGSYVDRKLVEATKRLEVESYITDINPIDRSPAKLIADHSFEINSSDVDTLIELCRSEHIDGVLSLYHDFSQTAYRIICERLGLPHFGNELQHKILTNKKYFKEFCEESGLGTIPYYKPNDEIEYPVIVKPYDGRGSKGQTICTEQSQLKTAIEFAKSYSKYEDVVIEKYLGNENDCELTYVVIDEEVILQRICDRFLGSKEYNLNNLCAASISPSKHEKFYMKNNNESVIKSLEKLKLKNSPIFLQGFMYQNEAMFYEPGIRLPGDDYDVGYKTITDIDIAEMFLRYALTGEIPNHYATDIKSAKLNKWIAMILPCLKSGHIAKIKGLDEIDDNANIVSWSSFYQVDDEVGVYNDSRQRFGEFIIVADSINKVKDTIQWIFETIEIKDDNDEDMLIAKFDVSNLDSYDDSMLSGN